MAPEAEAARRVAHLRAFSRLLAVVERSAPSCSVIIDPDARTVVPHCSMVSTIVKVTINMCVLVLPYPETVAEIV